MRLYQGSPGASQPLSPVAQLCPAASQPMGVVFQRTACLSTGAWRGPRSVTYWSLWAAREGGHQGFVPPPAWPLQGVPQGEGLTCRGAGGNRSRGCSAAPRVCAPPAPCLALGEAAVVLESAPSNGGLGWGRGGRGTFAPFVPCRGRAGAAPCCGASPRRAKRGGRSWAAATEQRPVKNPCEKPAGGTET